MKKLKKRHGRKKGKFFYVTMLLTKQRKPAGYFQNMTSAVLLQNEVAVAAKSLIASCRERTV
jgi:hypothetical protein